MQSASVTEAGLNMDRFKASSISKPSSLAGFTHSRSTSAGSSRSGGQTSIDLQKPVSYPTDALGLPEYDYPTPWSIEETHSGSDYPSALLVKNTFLATPVLRPASLEEYLEERGTQSCPASAIGLPPGLEDLVEPEEAAARLNKLAAEAALRRKAESTEVSSSYLPSGLFDEPLGLDSPQHFFHAAQQPVVPEWHNEQFQLQQRQPVVLDLMQALSDPFAAEAMQQHQFLDNQYACAAPLPYATQTSEPQLGTPECPTVGSRGHYFGECKPCAFFYTKGCGNGVNCPFCHLCDAGEKKRRQKENRAARRPSACNLKYPLH